MKAWQQGQQVDIPGVTLFHQPNATTLYIGEARPGTAPADNAWQIRRIMFDGTGFPSEIKYADEGRHCVWDDRETLEYA